MNDAITAAEFPATTSTTNQNPSNSMDVENACAISENETNSRPLESSSSEGLPNPANQDNLVGRKNAIREGINRIFLNFSF